MQSWLFFQERNQLRINFKMNETVLFKRDRESSYDILEKKKDIPAASVTEVDEFSHIFRD